MKNHATMEETVMRTLAKIAVVVCFLAGSVTAQTLIRVPQDQPTIQAGINAANTGDTVLVSEGTYVENIKINKKIVLASWFVRDDSISHISKTIINGSLPAHADSGSVILITKGADSTTVVSGFTITGGTGTRTVYDVSYTWKEGGGILLHGGGATISHNVITGNVVSTTYGSNGGGIAMFPRDTTLSYWIIEDNVIRENEVFTSAFSTYAAQGAGALLTEQGRFTTNVVTNNRSGGNVNVTGAGVYIGTPDRNWSLPDLSTNIVVANNRIHSNESTMWGGGIAMYAGSTVSRPNVTLLNNLITRNSATSGAGIHINSGTYALMNNTVVHNDSGPSGTVSNRAIYLEQSRGPLSFRMLNNIIWNPEALLEFYLAAGAVPTGNYNIIRNGLAGEGNIDADPDLEPQSGYYYLRGASPARDAGVWSGSVGGITLNAPSRDFRDSARAENPDMGAHEYDPLVNVKRLTTTAIPENFALDHNYPNPFNPRTKIRYQISEVSKVRLTIYDVLGREVTTLVNEKLNPGSYEVTWEAAGLPSGIYFYRLRAGEFVETKKMLLLR
ncbi:MAG: T9SS type A sorting domain-containing protein [Ignavibacteriales bacterium]|nr:T9SS type A sorting domain-containing protein [Ignavibacteriales bacterium]